MADEVIEYRPAPPRQAGGAAEAQLQTLLVPGETIVAHALQHRLYALVHRRQVAAATTGRFIFMTRPLLGGYQPFDVRWQDIKDAQLTVGMFSATVTLVYTANLSDTASGEGDVRVLRGRSRSCAPRPAASRSRPASIPAPRAALSGSLNSRAALRRRAMGPRNGSAARRTCSTRA